MQIRLYHDSDRSQVVSLWKSVFPDQTGRNDPDRSIDRKLAADDSLFFVAVESDRMLGTVMGGYDGHRGWMYSVAVSPDAQRQGIGTALLRHVERELIARGCPKINLQILVGNETVVEFYRSLGYVVEERVSMGRITGVS